MSKKTDSGYARNLGHFEQMLSLCRSYGAAYNPSQIRLSVAKMEQLLQLARLRLSDADETKNLLDQAINSRALEFKDLRALSTRILNTFSICGANALAIEDIKGHNRKIHGQRAAVRKKAAPSLDGAPTPDAPHTISAAQTSYDFQIEHFSKLMQAVAQEPAYQPNEPDLTTNGIVAKLNALQLANTAHSEAYTKWSNARFHRNFVFSDPKTGLLPIAANVKKYMKATFGTQSFQCKEVLGLAFKMVKQ